ncbi:MAG: response regulator [Kamptonema sp. SIO4C4]|nr:response regulator [Kamptonema sp. SIO4C4]
MLLTKTTSPTSNHVTSFLSSRSGSSSDDSVQKKISSPRGFHHYASDKTLLLIEPEQDLCEITKMSLEMTTDWHILVAESCQEGSAIAQRHNVQAILLDVDPNQSCPADLIQHLQHKTVNRNIPIIVLIDRVRLGDKQHFAQLGVAGVISKPFDALHLGTQIAYLLSWPELQAC